MKENMYQMQIELGLEWNDAKLQNHYRRKSTLVITMGERLAGFVFYELLDQGAFIHSLQINQRHQHAMLGYKLFKHIVGEVLNQDKHLIRCSVFENNQAHNMYKRMGFQEISQENRVIKLQLDLRNEGQRFLRKLEKT